MKHLFVAFVGLLVTLVLACGSASGPSAGDPCDPGTYAARCTDGVAIVCSPGSDCVHHDCASFGCSCYEDPHISRDDCSQRGERCVVDKDGARCQ